MLSGELSLQFALKPRTRVLGFSLPRPEALKMRVKIMFKNPLIWKTLKTLFGGDSYYFTLNRWHVQIKKGEKTRLRKWRNSTSGSEVTVALSNATDLKVMQMFYLQQVSSSHSDAVGSERAVKGAHLPLVHPLHQHVRGVVRPSVLVLLLQESDIQQRTCIIPLVFFFFGGGTKTIEVEKNWPWWCLHRSSGLCVWWRSPQSPPVPVAGSGARSWRGTVVWCNTHGTPAQKWI